MLSLNLPFHLTLDLSHAFLRGRGLTSGFSMAEVILRGLSVFLETGGRNYHVVSEQAPEPDRPGNSGGVIRHFCHWRLGTGVAIEQQMMLPAEGDAIAVSWRLTSRSVSTVKLTVTPVFDAAECLSSAFASGERSRMPEKRAHLLCAGSARATCATFPILQNTFRSSRCHGATISCRGLHELDHRVQVEEFDD